MATVTRELQCAKEITELGEGLTNFISAVRDALADGWQSGTDLPAIITAAFNDLIPAIQGVEEIPIELQDLETFVNGIFVGMSGLPFLFISPPDDPPGE